MNNVNGSLENLVVKSQYFDLKVTVFCIIKNDSKVTVFCFIKMIVMIILSIQSLEYILNRKKIKNQIDLIVNSKIILPITFTLRLIQYRHHIKNIKPPFLFYF